MCCIFKRRREAQRDERPAKERSSRRPRSKSLANNVFSAQKTRSPKMITRKKKLFLTSSCYCLFLRETRDTTRPGLICLSSEQIRFSLSLRGRVSLVVASRAGKTTKFRLKDRDKYREHRRMYVPGTSSTTFSLSFFYGCPFLFGHKYHSFYPS